METEAESYADHEFINLALNTELADGETTDEVVSLDPTAQELEPNQVAELVYYRRNAQSNGASLEFGFGYNVAEQDFIEQAAANQTDFTPDPNVSLSQGALYEEPGVIDFVEIPSASGQERNSDSREFAVKDKFNHGPFIDSTDDLDVHIEAANNTGVNGLNASVQVQAVYAIHEVAQGIPRFSDPRRLQD